MAEKSEEEIQRAIAHMERVAPLFPQKSAFGNDNRGVWDLQIKILKNHDKFMDFDEVVDMYDLDVDGDYDEYSAARDTWDWIEGDLDDEEGDLPATWDDYTDQKWVPA